MLYNKHLHIWICQILIIIGCVKDKNLGHRQFAIQDVRCKRQYTCAKLAKQNRCNQKFGHAMDVSCRVKLKNWWRNQQVDKHCKKSCNKCTGRF